MSADQLRRNGEPEPRPPKRRVVDVSACVNESKMRGLLLRSDADARIAHREVQRHGGSRRAAGAGRPLPSHMEHDLARLRELHGVADQVHDDLAQPCRIPLTAAGTPAST